jgi:hypothetical protein
MWNPLTDPDRADGIVVQASERRACRATDVRAVGGPTGFRTLM